MIIIEIMAVLFSLLSIYYAIHEYKISWIFGIIAVTFYGILFYNVGLYANFMLQILYFIQCSYGLYRWNASDLISIKRISKDERIYLAFLITIVWGVIVLLNTNIDMVVYLDSLMASLSIFASILLAYKKLETWNLWTLVNITGIVLFILSDLYLSVILACVSLFLSINGHHQWKKNLS